MDTSTRARKPLGELLIRDGVITGEQLEAALRLQAASPEYMPIGHVLLAHNFIPRRALTMTLRRYRKSARLGEVLLRAGHITPAQLEEALELQRGTPLQIGQMLVRLGWLRETTMRDALCMQLHVNLVDIDAVAIDRELARLIPESVARQYSLMPLARVDEVVIVAMDNPGRADVIAALERAVGLRIEVVTSVAQQLRAAMDRLYAAAELWPIGPSDGPMFVGPIRDYAVAELLLRARREVPVPQRA